MTDIELLKHTEIEMNWNYNWIYKKIKGKVHPKIKILGNTLF